MNDTGVQVVGSRSGEPDDLERNPGDTLVRFDAEPYRVLDVAPQVAIDRSVIALRDPATGVLYAVDRAAVLAVLS